MSQEFPFLTAVVVLLLSPLASTAQDSDGNCYAPGLRHDSNTFLDLDIARFPDPSEIPF